MPRYVRIVLFIAFSFAQLSAVAQEQSELLALIDQKILALEDDAKNYGASEKHFQNVGTLFGFVYKADVKPSDKFDRLLVVARQAISLRAGPAIRQDMINVEKRNIALSLLGVPLKDVNDPVLYSKLRERYSKVLVDFVVVLKAARIVGYQPKPVYLNMPVDINDNAATRSEKYQRFLFENNANDESNRYQESLKNEVEFLEPKVKDFLNMHYKEKPQDQKELE